MSTIYEDFEDLLINDFNEEEFANNILKSTNADSNTSTLDIETPIKKISYDIKEIESQMDQLITNNPSVMLNQIYKDRSVKETINTGLKPSLQYLDISYKRLQDDVLIPFERAQKLQSVLGKVHQTSNILRDALIYIHLANKIQSIMDSDKKLSIQKATQLTSLHSQLQLTIQENVNLKSLQVVKTLEIEIGKDNKKKLLEYLTLTLTKECLNTFKIRNNKDNIMTLSRNLFLLAPQEFLNTIYKIVLSHVASNTQILNRTINSIRTFPDAFEEVADKGHDIYILERTLVETKVNNNSNLLTEYSTLVKTQYSTPRELFWSKLSSNFKKDIDISYKRGGPVGKSLLKNKSLIMGSINKFMPQTTDKKDYQSNLSTMLKSVSILNSLDSQTLQSQQI